jgi:hypothetical protein
MWDFQYKHGDRPLEGYTIQRGAGRGGFGEVYYAISDAGREVALKAVHTYEQIELRGIGQCMNLKNPHLVTIFDVRYNEQGRPFVIMEFVAGPSLRQLLDESPSGLGTQKAAFFLREIGKGLTFLHENGIVHRDLKPANIFYENGYVKIGDYGLSKLITATHTSAQTVSVGTVHYMAPEIGAGKYDRSIDIYALGAVLYEMLTGMVPFNGATPSEVLMKHLSSEPDVTGIAEPFATVIRKAMAKDPAQRYQSVQGVVEAVFGAEHVRQSVSVFSPDQLSMVAAHAAQRVGVGAAVDGGTSSAAPRNGGVAINSLGRVGGRLDRFGDRIARLGDRMVDIGVRAVVAPAMHGVSSRALDVDPSANDPLSKGQRRLLALVAAAVAGLVGGVLPSHAHVVPIAAVFFVMLATLGGAMGIVLAARRLAPQIKSDSDVALRIGAGGLATLFAATLSLPFWTGTLLGRDLPGLWICTATPLFFMNSAAWTAPDREVRVSFWDSAFLAGLFSFILVTIFQPGILLPIVTTTAICLVTQILSPWNPLAAREAQAQDASAEEDTESPPVDEPAPAAPTPSGRPGRRIFWYRPVPRLARIIWLVASMLSLALGIASTVYASMLSQRRPEFPYAMASGITVIATAVLSFLQFWRKRFYGWLNYLIKPLLLLLCAWAVLYWSIYLGTNHPNDRELAVAVFMLIVFGQGLITVPFIPSRRVIGTAPPPPPAPARSPASSWTSPAAPAASASAAVAHAAAAVQHAWVVRGIERLRQRRIRRRRALGGWHYTLLGRVLILAAMACALVGALNIPQALSVGLPDRNTLHQLNDEIFRDFPAWPGLLLRLAAVGAILLTVLALGATAMARRLGGAAYLLRGIVGVVALVGSVALLAPAFHPSCWTAIADLLNHNRGPEALDKFMDSFDSPLLFRAGAVWIVAIILLAWPARSEKTPAAQSEGAGK